MDATVTLRAPMRSRDDRVDHDATLERALGLGLVGMGAARDERAERRLDRFVAVPDGSYAWTKTGAGLHLGRIVGPHQVDTTEDAARVDLVHVRACDWLPDPVDPALVPEQVSYAFSRGGRNLQRIGTPGAGERTAAVWDALS
ncbi:hypothetical protein GCM10009821_05990 [Aeromicrobium halocynthiae]|uniref:GAF domain-containing protein n=1 Tax=Aeromicrobium halocynthiae TaxID=560557 RepID=A0ABN2VT41_9ACTN